MRMRPNDLSICPVILECSNILGDGGFGFGLIPLFM